MLLITSIVGADLEMLLDACTIMGTEALVEVHTPSELEYALSVKATNFLVNNWDRMSGILYPEQVHLSFFTVIFSACLFVVKYLSLVWFFFFGACEYLAWLRCSFCCIDLLFFSSFLQAKGLINMMPMNALAIVAGNIKTMKEVIEFGNCGYDGVVLGRNIAEVSTLQGVICGAFSV